MTNKLTKDVVIRTITNRGSLLSPVLPSDPEFVPSVLASDAQGVHSYLRLGVTETDTWVLGVLQAVDSVAVLRALLEAGVHSRTYDLRGYRPPVWESHGAELGPDAQGIQTAVHTPRTWPCPRWLTVSHVAADAVKIVTDLGGSWVVGCRVFLDPRSILVDWPTDIQVTGALTNLSMNFGPGWAAGIPYEPTSYPYPAVAAGLRDSRDCGRLLVRAELAEAFYSARSPVEQVAVAAVALGLVHPQHPGWAA